MDSETFRRSAHRVADWITDYLAGSNDHRPCSPRSSPAISACRSPPRRLESIWSGTSLVPATRISADGEYLYVNGPRGVMRWRVSDGGIVDRTSNPIRPDLIRVASDDSFIVTATSVGGAHVSLIRMR